MRWTMREVGRSTVGVLLLVLLGAVATLAPASVAGAAGNPWSVIPSPIPHGAVKSSLAGTSCTSGAFCMAVGSSSLGPHDQAFSELHQYSGWSLVPTPSTSPNRDNDLYGVSCVSASFCVAVGVAADGGSAQTLTEQWNGTGWTMVSSPDTDPDENQQLTAVSCSSAVSCVAVGSARTGGRHHRHPGRAWNGTAWSIVDSPDQGTGGLSELDGVSCPAPTDCTATGYYFNGTVNQTLVESWNGTAWSIGTSPDVSPGTTSVLTSVSCPSPSACTAVGYSAAGSTLQTLVEQEGNGTWSIVPGPDTGPTDFDSAPVGLVRVRRPRAPRWARPHPTARPSPT